ncbi:hypothetical protein BDZ90DRAFT_185740 [Jaminaea rosea]|uniref:Chromatin-remodeling ATPase INO80 n=1 Tax=Jaminaea rosea TaxID=1569628 RepID=A0A316UP87_9BASI|nr:hypothetical protein BDZ90DRAFT_185740 [Jaminaea rosea]PWN27090.1 hypothetical protein BDZ90DRAFT_185740 [Jaminaea rosea]
MSGLPSHHTSLTSPGASGSSSNGANSNGFAANGVAMEQEVAASAVPSRPMMSISSILNDGGARQPSKTSASPMPPSASSLSPPPPSRAGWDNAHSTRQQHAERSAAGLAAASSPPRASRRNTQHPQQSPPMAAASSMERWSPASPSADGGRPAIVEPAMGSSSRPRGYSNGVSPPTDAAASHSKLRPPKAASMAAKSKSGYKTKRSRKKGDDFEEPDESNRFMWEDELEAYRVRLQLRAQAIEEAYEVRWEERHLSVEKRLAEGYEARLSAVVRKEEEKALIEQKRAEAAAKMQREAARRKKEAELDLELLATLEEGSPSTAHRSKNKSRPSKGHSKHASRPGPPDEAGDESGFGASTPSRGWRDKKRRMEDGPTGFPGASSPAGSDRGTPLPDADESMPMEPAGAGDQIPDPDGPPVPLDARRVRQLEDAHRRIWVNMARKEIPKVYRYVQSTTSSKASFAKRIAGVVERESRRVQARNSKSTKDVQQRSRKAMREMLVFWRRNEKEEKELRRKAEKEAADRLRKEEEMREAKRQARKLNFLITQTELYSHFVGNKLRTSEAEESEETSGGSKVIDPSPNNTDAPASVPPMDSHQQKDAAMHDSADNPELKDIDFDDDDESNLRAHAARNAQAAVLAAKDKAKAFDAVAEEERRKIKEMQGGEGEDAAASTSEKRIEEKDLGKAFDSDDMNFQNPTSMGQMNVTQPKMLTCQLKEYQLKGLNWLANLYEQGINGILADEMGLGKTVQSISLMSYLAEVHDIWGPFLVIAPSSTLHNWQQEISRFTPALKALPYWGNVKDRNILRKFWNKKHMSYNRDSPFHVLVTSYQLVVTDEKYFKRIKWQYMILDEAQAIKSSQSTRWRTLLSFNCRNRLLLTGTPVQNSMQELWALLHFIMPSLFDSHDEFSEWFSKDIEGHAENKGTLNEGQLRRLHMILKPFMLRRIKKNVQNELGDKIEIDVMCEMSARQKMLYRGLRENVSIAELMDRASNLHDEAGLKHLMNLVMQFRKVCNHPELFERADVTAPVHFGNFSRSGTFSREGDQLYCPDSATSAIEMRLPKLFVREGGLIKRPGPHTEAGFETKYLDGLFNIWRAGHIAKELQRDGSAFDALPLVDVSPKQAETAFHGHTAQQIIENIHREDRLAALEPYLCDNDFAASSVRPFARVSPRAAEIGPIDSAASLPPLTDVRQAYVQASPLANPEARVWQGPAIAPPVRLYADDGPFEAEQERQRRDHLVSSMLYGVPPPGCEREDLVEALRVPLPGLPPRGVLAESSVDQLPAAQMTVPQINKLIIDSSKLAHLDRLLRELKANDHRVLIYFQMTKMIDLMEEYLIYRQYKYLRLDGSSKISDRRDMVTDWQTKPELFVFLLSTRAGGLGINLTAADTVIFFDSDWNPSNDQQAMDRAHRLGQTKQVTVYRLITKGTIDERIIKMARNKKEVQDMVVGNKTYNEASGLAKPQEIVSLLMDDDQLADAMLRRRQAEEAALAQGKADNAREMHRKRRMNKEQAQCGGRSRGEDARDKLLDWTLDDDEDDFFGAKPPSATPKIEEIDSSRASPAASGNGRGRGRGRPSGSGRAASGTAKGPNKKKKTATAASKDGSPAAGDEEQGGPATASGSKKRPRTSTGDGEADGADKVGDTASSTAAPLADGANGSAPPPKKKRASMAQQSSVAPASEAPAQSAEASPKKPQES